MVYIHCDKKRQPLVLGGFWSTEQHQNQLKEQALSGYTLHSIFVTIKLQDDLSSTHRYMVSLLSLFISVILRFHVLIVWSPATFLPHSVFLFSLTLTVIILWIGVTASEEVRLTGNPYFLLSQHLIIVEKTHDFSIPPSSCAPLTLPILMWTKGQHSSLVPPPPPITTIQLAQKAKMLLYCNWKITI